MNHQYYCTFCREYLYAASEHGLAQNLNTHNHIHHPFESVTWTAAGIVFSSHYVGPGEKGVSWAEDIHGDTLSKPRPEYTEPHGTTSHSLDSKITESDKEMLEKLGVKW